MKNRVRRSVLQAFLFISALTGGAARAVDRDDFYATLYGGSRFDHHLQGGASFGYAPFDSFGFALQTDQTTFASALSLEGRWFLEPFEVAGSAGAYRNHDVANGGHERFMFMVGAAYLKAMTPAIALKLETRAQFVLKDTSSVFILAGGRLVW